MKTKLLFLLLFTLTLQAQTTHDLDWRVGIGTNVDLTIESGDAVRWTWRDSAPHTVTNLPGSAETFDSGTISGNGQTYIRIFNTIGTNPYQCDIHPSTMRGTITVQNPLSIEDNFQSDFSISPNPAQTFIKIDNNSSRSDGLKVKISDLLGKTIYSTIYDYGSKIDISNLKPGVYLIRLSNNNKRTIKRFIKL